jgi:hypothetical protein
MAASPEWLRERVNDPYGTPNKHPFWQTVEVEKVGNWKLFEKDGVWYGHDTLYNAWAHFASRDEAAEFASGGSVDVWA